MKYFTLEELCASPTAKKLGICNTPKKGHIVALERLVREVLDPVRETLGAPITVTSGYRTPALNVAVHGVKGSLHTKGMAADITCFNVRRLFFLIQEYYDFDQMIYYQSRGFIHVSYISPEKNRHNIIIRR